MSEVRSPWITLRPLTLVQGGHPVAEIGEWSIAPGDRWWVRGPNGAGKSTLLSLLAGDLWPAPGQHQRRIYHFANESTWSPMVAKDHVARLDPMRQNRYLHQDWDLTAAEVVATGFLDTDLLHSRPRPEEMARLSEIMERLGIGKLWSRPFLELSQGERRRTLIARALAKDPDVLLLDEFAEGLDEMARGQLWETLELLATEGKALVLTTHRPGAATEGWKTFDLAPISHVAEPVVPQALLADDALPETLIAVRGDFFLEGQCLLRALDWRLLRGQHTVVLGPNGSGKSSFLRLLWGELHLAVGGTVVHLEDPDMIVPDLRKRVGYFQPDMHAWFRPNQEVEDIILSGLHGTIDLFNPVTEGERRQVRAVAERFGVSHFLGRRFCTLSYGQARRVLLARALVSCPPIALLDEPFDGLDAHAREQLFAQLAPLAAHGQTTFVISCHHSEDQPPWIAQPVVIDPQARSLKRA